MIAISLTDNKLSFSGEVDLHELLRLEELDTRIEGLNYRIEKHMADIPGERALEIILSVNWAETNE